MSERYPSVEFMSLSVDSQEVWRSAGRDVLRQEGDTGVAGWADEKLQSAFRVRGVPTIAVLDSSGTIRYHQFGLSAALEEDLSTLLDQLAAE